MKNIIIRNIVAPMARRLGTAVAAFIGGVLAVSPELADQVGLGAAAVVLIAFDLVASHFSRGRENREYLMDRLPISIGYDED